jgi:hypothetical protein
MSVTICAFSLREIILGDNSFMDLNELFLTEFYELCMWHAFYVSIVVYSLGSTMKKCQDFMHLWLRNENRYEGVCSVIYQLKQFYTQEWRNC